MRSLPQSSRAALGCVHMVLITAGLVIGSSDVNPPSQREILLGKEREELSSGSRGRSV